MGSALSPGRSPRLSVRRRAPTYERLLKKIEDLAIYDNHAHPGFADDPDVDAMAAPPEESSLLRLREDNPEFVAASKALFGYPFDDFQPEHSQWLIDRKKAAQQAGNPAYFDGILDKLNTDVCLANRAFMAPYLNPRRFHWVFFGDSFFYPFDNRAQTASTPDMGVYIPLQEKMLARYREAGRPPRSAGGPRRLRRIRPSHLDRQQKARRGGHQI